MNTFNHLKVIAATMFTAVLCAGCLKEDINHAAGKLNPEISIFSIREALSGDEAALNKAFLDDAAYTSGIVISNHENHNMPSDIIAIQSTWKSQTRGILLRVDDAARYRFGDSLRIRIADLQLKRENGSLLIDGVSADRIEKLATGVAIPHNPVAIQTLLSRFDTYESTLISVTADIEPEPDENAPFSGDHILVDAEGNQLVMHTSANASFAQEKIAPSATFQGVAFRQGNDIQIRLQKYEDMTYPSGRLYAGWPETFEEPSHPKGSYNMPDIGNNVSFQTGEWHLYQAIIGTTAGRDRIVSGSNAIRMQQNRSDDEYLQMNFDVPHGASKVTFWYGSYYTDRSCTFQLEYSIDQGQTWNIVGEPIRDAHTTSESLDAKQAVFLVDIAVPVRFRINKLGLGQSSPTVENGRLGIDDFAVYQHY
ncbi:DUF5689 domain-containing protein [Parapedobacter deserti]|uniref:DUF5689 domain-containing protein n=1 Tax=Parapedobacter deserti TaxID=1912957 RepID=A0ABV7JJC9_9SPHI